MKKLSLYAASLILTLNSFSLNTEAKVVADDINISTTIDTEDELLDATSGEIKEPIKVGKIKVKVLVFRKKVVSLLSKSMLISTDRAGSR